MHVQRACRLQAAGQVPPLRIFQMSPLFHLQGQDKLCNGCQPEMDPLLNATNPRACSQALEHEGAHEPQITGGGGTQVLMVTEEDIVLNYFNPTTYCS